MEDNLPEVIGLFRCESEGDIKWSDDLTNSLAVYTRTPAKQSTPEAVRHDIDRVKKFIEYALTSVNGDKFEIAKAIENIIHHATRADAVEVVTVEEYDCGMCGRLCISKGETE